VNHFFKVIILSSFLISCSRFIPKDSKWLPKGQGAFHKSAFHLVWSKNYDPIYQTGNLPIALHYPLAYEGILFVGHNTGHMNALDLSTGRQIWKEKDNGGYHSAPVIYKDKIIYGTIEGRVYSRDYLTGKLNFSIDLGASIESEAVVYRGRAFFHLRNHKIFCLDVETGKILWAYKRSVPFLTTVQRSSKPVVYKNKLYVGFADGHVGTFAIEEGILLWERKISSGSKFVDVDQSPVFFAGNLIISSLAGPMSVLNPETGAVKRNLEFTASRAPMRYKDGLVVGSIDGEIIFLDSNLRVVKKLNLNFGRITSYVMWNKKLVIGTVEGRIILLDPAKFTVESVKYLGHSNSAIFGKMVVADDKLAVMSSRNRLYVFQ